MLVGVAFGVDGRGCWAAWSCVAAVQHMRFVWREAMLSTRPEVRGEVAVH